MDRSGDAAGRRTISLAEIADGRIPDELQGIRWPDGTVECRFNISADDYVERVHGDGPAAPGEAVILRGNPVDCHDCASKCSTA